MGGFKIVEKRDTLLTNKKYRKLDIPDDPELE